MSDQILEFYRAVRQDDARMAELASAESESALTASVLRMGEELGFGLSAESIRQGLSSVRDLIAEAAGDGELSDAELAFVSGGKTQCNDTGA